MKVMRGEQRLQHKERERRARRGKELGREEKSGKSGHPPFPHIDKQFRNLPLLKIGARSVLIPHYVDLTLPNTNPLSMTLSTQLVHRSFHTTNTTYQQ